MRNSSETARGVSVTAGSSDLLTFQKALLKPTNSRFYQIYPFFLLFTHHTMHYLCILYVCIFMIIITGRENSKIHVKKMTSLDSIKDLFSRCKCSFQINFQIFSSLHTLASQIFITNVHYALLKPTKQRAKIYLIKFER